MAVAAARGGGGAEAGSQHEPEHHVVTIEVRGEVEEEEQR